MCVSHFWSATLGPLFNTQDTNLPSHDWNQYGVGHSFEEMYPEWETSGKRFLDIVVDFGIKVLCKFESLNCFQVLTCITRWRRNA